MVIPQRPAPVLNRFITVKGTKTGGEGVPKIWTFDNPGYGRVNGVQILGGNNIRFSPPLTANGSWTALQSLGVPWPVPDDNGDIPRLTTAAQLVGIGYLGYSSLLTENGRTVETPRPQVVTGITPAKAYLFDDDGNIVLTWFLVANSYYHALKAAPGTLINTYVVQVDHGSLTGADYTLVDEAGDRFIDGHIGFEASKVTAQAVGNPLDKGVWARLTEQGQRAGILGLTSGDVLVTEIYATVVTRYDPDLDIAETVVDDVHRTWKVSEGHSILDRRYYQMEIVRTVAA